MTVPQGYNLVWSDEFDGTSLNSSKWKQTVGPSSNVKVANSKVELWANPVGNFNGSAFISTPATFKYGYFECSAQISTVQGIAFAFWLLDPGGSSPEIDIVERPGNAPGYQNICVFSAKGTDGQWASGGVHQSFPATATGFHKYALLWTSTELNFYVDDVKGWSAPSSVVSKNTVALNVKLDICAGGCSFQGVIINPLPNTPPTHVEVEYVRIYQQGAPVTKYRCTSAPNYQCVEDPSGPFNSLAECQAACKAQVTKFRCTGSPDFQCVEDSSGQYNSLAECQAACKQTVTKYRCTGSPDFQCVEDSSGQYNSLAECQAACKQTEKIFRVYKVGSTGVTVLKSRTGDHTADEACKESCDIIKSIT